MIKHITTVLSFSAVLAVLPVQAAPTTWDMPNEYPATSIQGKGDQFFAEQLQKNTKGQIKIAHHFGGALGLKSKDQLDAVGDGMVEVANTFISPLGGIHPIFLLSSLPLLTSNSAEARQLFEAAKPEYDRVLHKYNQKLLYPSPWPSSGLWGKTAMVDHNAIDHLKMRTYDVNGTKVFRAAGSSPLQLSWADIVPQLSTGGINSVLTSIEAGLSSSFNDYSTHFTALNYDSTINLVTINLDTWENLSLELQQAVLDAAAKTEDHVWANIDKVVQQNYIEARSRGVTVIEEIPTAFREELQALAAPVIADWTRKMGESGKKILAQYSEGREPLVAAQ